MSTSSSAGARTDPGRGSGLSASISLGRIWGVPVRAHWSVLIVMLLIGTSLAREALPTAVPGRPAWEYALAGAAAAAVFLLGLLAHEAAHAVVARRNGVQVGTITLWMFGGITELRGEAETPGAEMRIAGAGPLVSFLLGIGFGVLALAAATLGWPDLLVVVLSWLAAINVLLALFNVLPGAPLDGGRLLRAALWRWRGDRVWASITAARAGRVLGMVLIVLGALEFTQYDGGLSGLWLALIGWFLMGAARTEEQQARLRDELSGVRVRDVMTPSPETVSADLSVAEFIDRYLWGYRHSTLPVVQGGRLLGLVTLERVRAVPASARTTTTLGEIACPISEVPIASPDEPLTVLLTRLDRSADGRALVIDGGELVGIVTPVDVTRAVELARTRQQMA